MEIFTNCAYSPVNTNGQETVMYAYRSKYGYCIFMVDIVPGLILLLKTLLHLIEFDPNFTYIRLLWFMNVRKIRVPAVLGLTKKHTFRLLSLLS
jgi:hypothetical protein